MNFTRASVAGLPAAENRPRDEYKDNCEQGLQLHVSRHGVKTFFLYRKHLRDPLRIKLGRFPEISVSQARNLAQQEKARLTLEKLEMLMKKDRSSQRFRHSEQEQKEITLLELIDLYEKNRGTDWSAGSKVTFTWAKNQLTEFHKKEVSRLNYRHWQNWLPEWREEGDYAPATFNHLRSFLRSIYSLAEAVEIFPSNPIQPIPLAKKKKKQVVIASNKEVQELLNRALKEDPEMVPWLAIAFFAGLRPESELGVLDWTDINFEEKWIRVDFGNKTDTKRFVDLSDTLIAWLKPFRKKRGSIQQRNHRKRKSNLVEGILNWERDISRHTYGSNLEAQARADNKDSRNVVLENMGHTTLQTFNQHYRNARTAKQAAEYWQILPQKQAA